MANCAVVGIVDVTTRALTHRVSNQGIALGPEAWIITAAWTDVAEKHGKKEQPVAGPEQHNTQIHTEIEDLLVKIP